jgi:hypothetical protein
MYEEPQRRVAARLAASWSAVRATGATRERTAANSRLVATKPQAAHKPYRKASRYEAMCGKACLAIWWARCIRALRSIAEVAVMASPSTEGRFPGRPAVPEFLGLLGEPEAPEGGVEVHAGLEEVAELAGLGFGTGGLEGDAVGHMNFPIALV